MIKARGLTRVFRSYKKAEGLKRSVTGFFKRDHLDKVALAPTDLDIGGGTIIGLVGANGAGKTTLLKLLSGLIHPTAGEATVLGHVPWRREQAYLSQISILLGQKNQLWWDIPPADSYDLLGRIYRLDRMAARRRVQELATMLHCQDVLHVQLRRLSLGERMKAELIGALLHSPKVLFLDEPTIGLDIVAQTAVRQFLAEYRERERPTIILTSHYMDDIAKLAERLLLISHGRIVYDGGLTAFMARAKTRQRLTFKVSTPPLQAIPLGFGLEIPAGAQAFTGELPAEGVAPALQHALSQVRIADLRLEETDFEDVIRDFLTGELRGREAGRPAAT